MKSKEGFSLIELLVTMVIIVLLAGIAYNGFSILMRITKQESSLVTSHIEVATGLELLRLDIEHLGYGIAKNEDEKIVEWNNGTLTIRSTINNTKPKTRGYLIPKRVGGSLTTIVDAREKTGAGSCSILKGKDKRFFAIGTISGSDISVSGVSCTNSEVYIAFPMVNPNGCNNRCYEVQYYISSTADKPDRCNPHTGVLERKVGESRPLLNCVADWKVVLDGVSTSNATNDDIRENLKSVKVYLLVQEGKRDVNYTFTGNTTIDGITLNLPDDYQHYRWKIIKFVVRPRNL